MLKTQKVIKFEKDKTYYTYDVIHLLRYIPNNMYTQTHNGAIGGGAIVFNHNMTVTIGVEAVIDEEG